MSKLDLLNQLLEKEVIDFSMVLRGNRHAHLLFNENRDGFIHGLKWKEKDNGYILTAELYDHLDYALAPVNAFPEGMRQYLKRSYDFGSNYTSLTCSKDIPEELLHELIDASYQQPKSVI
ncbi:hypothetical protein Lsan_2244 [Legionella santicrucis]|uniref:Uncharacterized protein n=1 Tax=Legionella santicrucis TaxID=45074 RepID=A0A0W0YR12_9GAMM|nr:hypothetical protein [Legionella santicrucis]KTD59340.1 hypothetical protein Lsan_2244 [Legionella santicrucis]